MEVTGKNGIWEGLKFQLHNTIHSPPFKKNRGSIQVIIINYYDHGNQVFFKKGEKNSLKLTNPNPWMFFLSYEVSMSIFSSFSALQRFVIAMHVVRRICILIVRHFVFSDHFLHSYNLNI